MKREVKVKKVMGKKTLSVAGLDLLGNTAKVREKVEALDIEPENHAVEEVVAEIELGEQVE